MEAAGRTDSNPAAPACCGCERLPGGGCEYGTNLYTIMYFAFELRCGCTHLILYESAPAGGGCARSGRRVMAGARCGSQRSGEEDEGCARVSSELRGHAAAVGRGER